jgi:hypothetical protein
MDRDGKDVAWSFCQSKWAGEFFVLITAVGTFTATAPSLFASTRSNAANLDKLTASLAAAAKQVPPQFPAISQTDAGSAQSRNRYSTRKCSWELKKLKETLSGKDTPDRINGLIEFVAKFTVHNADSIYGQLLQTKMNEKPTSDQICLESLYIALEQTLPFAKNLGCQEKFLEQLGKSYNSLFDIFKEEFKAVTHLSQNRPNSGSGITTAFADEYAQKMEEKICSIAKQYDTLFNIKNCPEEISALLSEYAKEIGENMDNAKRNLGNFQAGAALNRIGDTLAQFIVSKASEIAEKFPNEKLVSIYRAIAVTTLQFILPAVSEMGPLWGFANMLKNTGTSPLRKNFEAAFRLHGTFIVDQRGQTKEEQYIAVQVDTIIELLRGIGRNYLDMFQKRDSPNWPI